MELKQLYAPHEPWEVPQDVFPNLEVLCSKLTLFENEYGESFKVTSGWRSNDDMVRIYQEKNKDRISRGLDPVPVPLHSAHRKAAAADLYDPDGYVKAWIDRNLSFVVQVGFYFEDFKYTNGYVHCQIIPPKSGLRFFRPW